MFMTGVLCTVYGAQVYFHLLKVKNSSLLCNNRLCELDFEMEPSIDIVVKVTDDGVPPLTFSATLTVTLTNKNDPPRDIRLAGNSVAENAAPSTVGMYNITYKSIDSYVNIVTVKVVILLGKNFAIVSPRCYAWLQVRLLCVVIFTWGKFP